MTITSLTTVSAGSTVLPAGPPGKQGIQGISAIPAIAGLQGAPGQVGPPGPQGGAGPAPFATPVPYAAGINASASAPATTVIQAGIIYICIASHITTSSFVGANWVALPTLTGVSTLNGLTGNPNIVAGGGASVTPSGSSIIVSEPGGLINKFRNAHMNIAQRGLSGTIATGLTAYSLDGWQIAPVGATAAWSQQYNQNLAGSALRIACASGMTALTLQQRIESYIAADLLAKNKTGLPITIQFTIANNSGATITPQIATDFATSQDGFSTVTNDLAPTNLQPIANGAVGTVSYTYTANAAIANGLQVRLLFGGALNAATGNIDISFADVRVTPGLSTGLNANPPPPETRPIHTEMAFCQRYFTQSYGNGIAPGSNNHNGLVQSAFLLSGSWLISSQVFFAVQMRAPPASIPFWDGAGNASKVSSISGATGVLPFTDNTSNTGIGAFAISAVGFIAQHLTAGFTDTFYIHYSASAEL